MRTMWIGMLLLTMGWLAAAEEKSSEALPKKRALNGLEVETFSDGAYPVAGGRGMKMFSNRPAEKGTLATCPPELNGYLGIQTALTKVETVIDFSVNKPVRVFGPLYGITWGGESKARWAAKVPEGWKLYAFNVPFRDGTRDIYYKDFPAGRQRIEIGAFFFIPAIIPIEKLSAGMRFIPSLERPLEKEYFLPGEDAFLLLQIDNQAQSRKAANVSWQNIPTANRTIVSGKLTADAKPGVTQHRISLGKLTERGVYRVEVQVASGDQQWKLWAPIGVFPKPEKRITWSADTFPIGPYLKPILVSGRFGMFTEPYFRATCEDLSRRGFTMLKNAESLKELDIAAEYGLKAIVYLKDYYSAEALNHPATLAAMVMDEITLENVAYTRKCYDEIAKLRPDIPIVTCEVGESTGDYTKSDPLRVWPMLNPNLRLIRYYPFHKGVYGLERYMVYKGWMSVDSALRATEAACGTPYWFVAQTFGKPVTVQNPEPYWRTPTPVELKAQLHLALARGAQGLSFYTYQAEGDGEAMVDQASLEPSPNGLLDAATEFARLVGKHGKLLKELRFGGWIEAIPEQEHVIPVPRYHGTNDQSGEKYLYLVNIKTDRPAAGNLSFSVKMKPFAYIEDVYAGKRIDAVKKDGRLTVPYALEPGGGALWHIVTEDKANAKPKDAGDP